MTPKSILKRHYAQDVCCVCSRPIERDGLPREEIIRKLRGCQVRMHDGACLDIYESHHGTIENPIEFIPARVLRKQLAED